MSCGQVIQGGQSVHVNRHPGINACATKHRQKGQSEIAASIAHWINVISCWVSIEGQHREPTWKPWARTPSVFGSFVRLSRLFHIYVKCNNCYCLFYCNAILAEFLCSTDTYWCNARFGLDCVPCVWAWLISQLSYISTRAAFAP